jgi:D-glycero-D-manno-heptose 1,7-bisphosphate phosphatase
MRLRAIFLDRDGVVNKVVFRDGKPSAPRALTEFEFESGVKECLAALRGAGFKLFVVTNQPDLKRGLLSSEALRGMTDRVMSGLGLDAIKVCPHDDSDKCSCRKPQPGMIVELAREHDIDLTRSFMIGDSWRDCAAAAAAGCRSIILDRSYNRGEGADLRVADLSQAVKSILGERQ